MEWIAAAIVLALFIYFPKKMFVILGGLALIGGLIGSYFYYQDWSDKKEKAAVEVIVEYSPKKCEEPYPLKIIVGNSSNRIVTKVKWDIAVHQQGFSTDLSEYGYHEYSDDKILKPKEGWGICVRIPKLKKKIKNLSGLEFSIKNKYVIFE